MGPPSSGQPPVKPEEDDVLLGRARSPVKPTIDRVNDTGLKGVAEILVNDLKMDVEALAKETTIGTNETTGQVMDPTALGETLALGEPGSLTPTKLAFNLLSQALDLGLNVFGKTKEATKDLWRFLKRKCIDAVRGGFKILEWFKQYNKSLPGPEQLTDQELLALEDDPYITQAANRRNSLSFANRLYNLFGGARDEVAKKLGVAREKIASATGELSIDKLGAAIRNMSASVTETGKGVASYVRATAKDAQEKLTQFINKKKLGEYAGKCWEMTDGAWKCVCPWGSAFNTLPPIRGMLAIEDDPSRSGDGHTAVPKDAKRWYQKLGLKETALATWGAVVEAYEKKKAAAQEALEPAKASGGEALKAAQQQLKSIKEAAAKILKENTWIIQGPLAVSGGNIMDELDSES